MKKYTIIHNRAFRSGSHTHTSTELDRVETDNLPLLIKEQYPNAIFVFEGHPVQEGEGVDEKPFSAKLPLEVSSSFRVDGATFVQLGNAIKSDVCLMRNETEEDSKLIDYVRKIWGS